MQRDSSSTAMFRMGIPAALDGFATIAGHADGVNVNGLAPFTQLVVQTKNSIYSVNVQGGTSALVQGGRFFLRPTAAEVCGGTMGGSIIKIGWIIVGFCMELVADGQRIVTTRVRTIGVHPPSGQSRPH